MMSALSTVATASALACVPPPDRAGARARDAQEAQPEAEPSPAVASNGFGDADITWHELEHGFAEAARLHLPIMLVVHTSWCSRCKALKSKFSDRDVEDLATGFVMINVDQDAEPKVEDHGPDGNYIPRILFFDSSGKIDESLVNESRDRTRYFYMPNDDLAGTMRKALDLHGKQS
jgi:thiol:disulfide interchange protein